jgi:N-dimethylarginine dimethylaminohydrolase
MRVLMCRPDYYDIEYEINPWMNKTRKANHQRAVEQWEGLFQVIQECGAKVELVPPVRGLPDMTFAANAGLLYDGKIILANFKVIERKGEVSYTQSWFEKAGFNVVNRPGIDQHISYFEGAGDALHTTNKLFVGCGFRSEREFYENSEHFDPKKLVICELVNPYYYHIDTCFCPLNDHQAIWFPAAFSKESRERMSQEIELIAVEEEEARRFACNSVVLNQYVIMPSGCPKLGEILKSRGFTVRSCEVDEYIKAGGACKCLTMKLE